MVPYFFFSECKESGRNERQADARIDRILNHNAALLAANHLGVGSRIPAQNNIELAPLPDTG